MCRARRNRPAPPFLLGGSENRLWALLRHRITDRFLRKNMLLWAWSGEAKVIQRLSGKAQSGKYVRFTRSSQFIQSAYSFLRCTLPHLKDQPHRNRRARRRVAPVKYSQPGALGAFENRYSTCVSFSSNPRTSAL